MEFLSVGNGAEFTGASLYFLAFIVSFFVYKP